jgi:hypothetical protein
MKTKPKLIIGVIATLIIGFILGMLTSAQIRHHKLAPVSVYFSEERFKDGFYHAIQPDDQQKAKIDIILNKFAKLNSRLQNNFRSELDANMMSFRKEIDSYLTPQQLERLKKMDERRLKMIREHRKNFENDSIKFQHPQIGPGDSTGLSNRK